MKLEVLKFYHVILLEQMRSFTHKWEGNLRQDNESSLQIFGFTFT